jgi:hypothetical protein
MKKGEKNRDFLTGLAGLSKSPGTFGKEGGFWKGRGLLESSFFRFAYRLPSLTSDPISQGNNLN